MLYVVRKSAELLPGDSHTLSCSFVVRPLSEASLDNLFRGGLYARVKEIWQDRECLLRDDMSCGVSIDV
jgi:hypothetical protein